MFFRGICQNFTWVPSRPRMWSVFKVAQVWQGRLDINTKAWQMPQRGCSWMSIALFSDGHFTTITFGCYNTLAYAGTKTGMGLSSLQYGYHRNKRLGKSTWNRLRYFTTPDIFYLGLDYDRIIADSREVYEIVFQFHKFNFLSLSH